MLKIRLYRENGGKLNVIGRAGESNVLPGGSSGGSEWQLKSSQVDLNGQGESLKAAASHCQGGCPGGPGGDGT